MLTTQIILHLINIYNDRQVIGYTHCKIPNAIVKGNEIIKKPQCKCEPHPMLAHVLTLIVSSVIDGSAPAPYYHALCA